MRPFTMDEWVRATLAASRIRDEIDAELGQLLLIAIRNDTPAAWAAVHDRFNILGDFAAADDVRNFAVQLQDRK